MPILLATDEHGMTTVERHMNGAIVVASFAVVMVSMTSVGATVGLRVTGAVYVFDVLCDLLGPVVICGQISGGV